MAEIPPVIPPVVPPVIPPTPPVVPPIVPPVAPIPPEPIKKEEKPPVKANPKDNPIVVRYANKLKSDLGTSYSDKFDSMAIEQRVIAMEAAVDVLAKMKVPIKKGTAETPLGEPAPIERKIKTTLQLQQENGYRSKLRHKQSAFHRTSALLGKK